jgi:hypothetical protein
MHSINKATLFFFFLFSSHSFFGDWWVNIEENCQRHLAEKFIGSQKNLVQCYSPPGVFSSQQLSTLQNTYKVSRNTAEMWLYMVNLSHEIHTQDKEKQTKLLSLQSSAQHRLDLEEAFFILSATNKAIKEGNPNEEEKKALQSSMEMLYLSWPLLKSTSIQKLLEKSSELSSSDFQKSLDQSFLKSQKENLKRQKRHRNILTKAKDPYFKPTKDDLDDFYDNEKLMQDYVFYNKSYKHKIILDGDHKVIDLNSAYCRLHHKKLSRETTQALYDGGMIIFDGALLYLSGSASATVRGPIFLSRLHRMTGVSKTARVALTSSEVLRLNEELKNCQAGDQTCSDAFNGQNMAISLALLGSVMGGKFLGPRLKNIVLEFNKKAQSLKGLSKRLFLKKYAVKKINQLKKKVGEKDVQGFLKTVLSAPLKIQKGMGQVINKLSGKQLEKMMAKIKKLEKGCAR